MGLKPVHLLSALNPLTAVQNTALAMGGEKAAVETVKGVDKATGAKADRDRMAKAAEDSLAAQRRLEQEAKDRADQEAKDEAAKTLRDQARKKQREMSSIGSVRDTVATSPLGIPGGGAAPAGKKTLLGL